MTHSKQTHCGYVAIIGRPNVGKSTLLNHLIGQKISITSRKPQTTRYRILGIKTAAANQIVYVDTPGLHGGVKRAINRLMVQVVSNVIDEVDVILWVVEAVKWTDEDEQVLAKLQGSKLPVILAVNKIDNVSEKARLFEYVEKLADKFSFTAIFPISAKHGHNLPELEKKIATLLPESPHLFPEDQITDKNYKFLCAEFIREKLFRETGEELPYAMAVDIEKFTLENDIYHVSAVIFVEKESQKRMVIGKKGEKLKEVGRQARLAIENMLDKKVFLQLWVKVKPDWVNRESGMIQ